MKFHIERLVLFTALLVASIVPTAAVQALPGGTESINGWLSIDWGDARNGATTMQIILTTDAGDQIPVAIDDAQAEPLGGLLALNRSRVTLTGSWSSVAEGNPPSFRAASLTRPAGAERTSAPSAVTGSEPWASVLCKFKDDPSEPKPWSYFQDMYSSAYPGLDHYWREVSYGMSNVSGSTAAGWYTLPQARSYYVYNGKLDFDRAAKDCTQVADPYIDFS